MATTLDGNTLMKIEKKSELKAADSKLKTPWLTRLPIFGEAARGLTRRQFESRLSKLVNSALAHEQEGLEPGSDAYKRLRNMAEDTIDSYCDRYQVSKLDLEAQIPMITKLRNLARPKEKETPVWLKPSAIIGTLFFLTLVAMILGVEAGVVEAAKAGIVHHFMAR